MERISLAMKISMAYMIEERVSQRLPCKGQNVMFSSNVVWWSAVLHLEGPKKLHKKRERDESEGGIPHT